MTKVLLFCFAIWAVSFGQRNASQLFSSSYVLYTKNHYKFGQSLEASEDSVSRLSIRRETLCAVIVHGYGSRGNDSMSLVLRDAFLASGDTNVIVVDWNIAASSNRASDAVPAIAYNVVELLNLMLRYIQISKTNLHLIGFDLGAHVVGNVGRIIRDVARITALNPLGSGKWMLNDNHLRATDALYVEAIHTEVSQIQLPITMGDVDFFPQGGAKQPGCRDLDCSSNRAWQLFAASLTHGGLLGHRCDSIQEALDFNRSCTGFILPLGTNEFVKYGTGIFRLETSAVYPYTNNVGCAMVDDVPKDVKNLDSDSELLHQ